jgi:hypothetical protein
MNVEIGAEAALFPEKEFINGISVAVQEESATYVEIFTWFTPRIFGVGLFPVRKGCRRKCGSGRCKVDKKKKEEWCSSSKITGETGLMRRPRSPLCGEAGRRYSRMKMSLIDPHIRRSSFEHTQRCEWPKRKTRKCYEGGPQTL